MRSSRSLFVVAAVTVLSALFSVTASVAGPDLVTEGPFAVAGFVLFGLLQAALVPVFFAALYVDAGVVRDGPSPWSPSRWLWVGGGALAAVVAYWTVHNTTVVVVPVGVAYLGRRFYAARHAGDTTEQPRAASGDALDAERSLAGVLVHVLALSAAVAAFPVTSDVAVTFLASSGVAAVVYAASDHSFTRANARNALNWSLSVLAFATISTVPAALYAMDGQFYLFAVSGPLFPPALTRAVELGSFALVLATVAVLVATVPIAVFAAWQAAMGSPWSYPLAASVVERFT